MSKNAVVEIESKNKRGRAKSAFTRPDFIHHTQKFSLVCFKIYLPQHKNQQQQLTKTVTAEVDSTTQNPRSRGKHPAVNPKTGLPTQPSSAKSEASDKNTKTSPAMSLRKRHT